MSSSSSLSTSLILGCSSLAGLYHPVSEEEAIATVLKAREHGIVMFDTAPHYGCGLSEQRLGKALCQPYETIHHPIQLYTKVGRIMVNVDPIELTKLYDNSNEGKQYYQEREIDIHNVPGSSSCIFPDAPRTVLPVFDYSRSGALKSYEDSVQRLLVVSSSNKDVSLRLRIHDCETTAHITQVLDPDEGALKGLVELRNQKKIDDISIGVNDLAAAMRIVFDAPHGSLNSVMIAGQWNLLDHSVECMTLFDACEERNIRIHNAGIFASGVISGGSTHRYRPVTPDITKKMEQWNDLCRQYNIDLPVVAMKFALLPSAVEAIAVGAKSPREVTEIVTWFQCTFDRWLDLFADAHQRHLLTDPVHAYLAKMIGDG